MPKAPEGGALGALFSLADRVALVTGGTGGVGTLLARGLLLAGARVLLSGRDAEAGAKAVETLSEYGPCEFVAGDLSGAAGIEALAAEVGQRAPQLDVLVNNAGITMRAELGEYRERDVDEVLALNVKAPLLLSQALHPILKRNAQAGRPAHIVNTSSVAARITTARSLIYGPSKAALDQLTRVLARQLAADHIHVNAISPGVFPSNMTAEIFEDEAKRRATLGRTPVGRVGEPDDLATLIVAIICNNYMTGNVIPIDGGMGI